MFAAIIPPTIAHAQQQMLGMFTKGIAERIPRITPPINAGFILSFMSVYTFTWEKIEKLRSGVSVSTAGAKTLASAAGHQRRAKTRVTLRGEVRAGSAASKG